MSGKSMFRLQIIRMERQKTDKISKLKTIKNNIKKNINEQKCLSKRFVMSDKSSIKKD